MSTKTLEIRLLGELAVKRAGRTVALPASKKTRALLAYLIRSPEPQSRERLCELFWEGPVDPRGALRWSLTKLRPLVDDGEVVRLSADRERVAFESHGASVDIEELRRQLRAGPGKATTEALVQAAALFRGELLEGLDLPDCYRYHQWLAGEREEVRAMRTALLAELIRRRHDAPAEALRYARDWLAIEPFAETAHAAVVRLLGELGHVRDAIAHYESCKRLLLQEMRAKPSPQLEDARRALRALRDEEESRAAPAARAAVEPAAKTAALVGRERELAAAEGLLAAATAGKGGHLLFFSGEPGIGKTRLLREVAERTAARRGAVLGGRAFEAEMVRPYGAWIDALRSIPRAAPAELPAALRADLAPLLPELSDAPRGGGDRTRLFEAVTQLLALLGERRGPLLVVLDDVHWMDDASIALLHYTLRALHGSRTLLAGAARTAELAENPAADRLLRELAREGSLTRCDLSPLGAEETRALARAAAPSADGARVFADSQGNPLFAIEIARSLARGEAGAPETLLGLLGDRLARLDGRARDLVPWAAALGRDFRAELLGQIAGVPSADLLSGVEDLELHGVLRAAGAGLDFVHDLVRRAAYRQISEPRRRLIHREIARALAAEPDADGAWAGDVAHHAALGGDAELAAQACVAGGERSLRLFAYTEAVELAERGLSHLSQLPPLPRLRLHIDLLRVFVLSRRGRARSRELEGELSRLVLEARHAGLHAQVQTGLFLLSVLSHEEGDFAGAERHTRQQAEAAREADPATAARALANTGRCLSQIERDLPRAAALLAEAQKIAAPLDLELLDLHWGLGMLHHFEGQTEAARRDLGQALTIARRQDHWSEYECLSRLVMIDLEEGDPASALARTGELQAVAAKLGEGSEAPMSHALEALARFALGEPQAEAGIENALAALRAVDAKGLLAYVLNVAAERDLVAGAWARAREHAEEALEASTAVDRRAQIVMARALLAQAAHRTGEGRDAHRHLEAGHMDEGQGVPARARRALVRAAAELGVDTAGRPGARPAG